MTEEAQENYQKLLVEVEEAYGDHIQVQDNELYFVARDRYGFNTYITLTEAQVIALAFGVRDRLESAKRRLEPYIENYYHFIKLGGEK